MQIDEKSHFTIIMGDHNSNVKFGDGEECIKIKKVKEEKDV